MTAKHTPVMHRYSNIEFNGLPPWARDHILALEAERDLLREINKELVEACKAAFALLDDMGCTKNSPIRTVWAQCQAAIASAEGKVKP